MQLSKSDVIFNPVEHTYTINGITLSGITSVISRQLFPDKYCNVPPEILRKAAERGTMIHEICELIDDLGVSHESSEAKNYQSLKDLHGLCYEASEYLVSDNEHFASCIDKVYRESDNEFTIGDIKTTYRLDKESVRWQLSIYAHLFEIQNPECKVVRLIAIWLRGNTAEIVEIERIPDKTIIELLSCEVEGKQFVNPYSSSAEKLNMPDTYRAIEDSIIEIDEQAKFWADKKKDLMEGVMKEMVKAGVYKWQGESLQFIRKKDSIRKSFDKEAFEKDYPGAYDKYLKESPVVGSITLKIN